MPPVNREMYICALLAVELGAESTGSNPGVTDGAALT